jgi:hypothetical protein
LAKGVFVNTQAIIAELVEERDLRRGDQRFERREERAWQTKAPRDINRERSAWASPDVCCGQEKDR